MAYPQFSILLCGSATKQPAPIHLAPATASFMSWRRKRQRISKNGAAVIPAVRPDSKDEKLAHQNQEHATTGGPQGLSLFVRSLPVTVTSERLAKFFSQSYPVKHAVVILDKGTGQSKGFGFVTFADLEDALRARDEFNGCLFEDKRLQIDFARPRQRDSQRALADLHEPSPSPCLIPKASTARVHENGPSDDHVRLIVRNLPWSIKEPKQLARLFLSYGKVIGATLPKCKPGLSPGFGFVMLRGQKNAEKAIAGMNTRAVDGRFLAVDRAVDKATWQASQCSQPNSNAAVLPGEEEESHNQGSEAKAHQSQSTSVNTSASDALEESDDVDKSASTSDAPSGGATLEDFNGQPASPDKEVVSCTLFVRNLPYETTDEDLFHHFEAFGSLRYARVVLDDETGRSKGTGFLCFWKKEDASGCLLRSPKAGDFRQAGGMKTTRAAAGASLLQDIASDPLGLFTMHDRVVTVTQAVGKDDAHRLTSHKIAATTKQAQDKRHLFLLSEGTITTQSPLDTALSLSEARTREQIAKQRAKMVKNNLSLHVSLTRLSVRNIPSHMTSKDLKALARQAVVGFAKDVKQGRRQPLSQEERSRDREQMKSAERNRRLKGRGIVKQAKIIGENGGGDSTKAHDSAQSGLRLGFIEYSSHRWALMGLRWLNGSQAQRPITGGNLQSQASTRRKRLLVEFAIENARIIAYRQNRQPRDFKPSIDTSNMSIAIKGEDHLQDLRNRKGYSDRSGCQHPGKPEDARLPLKFMQTLPQESSRSQHKEQTDVQQIVRRKRAVRRAGRARTR